jgi:hypothetical protein
MESFVDTHGRPVSRIDLAVGETKIVGLKKYALTPSVEVGVLVRNSSIAFSDQCVYLGDPTKKKYIDVYDMAEVAQANVPIEISGKFFSSMRTGCRSHRNRCVLLDFPEKDGHSLRAFTQDHCNG